jgi:hypothetical protein
MRRWLWIIGVLGLATSLVLAFDDWRREPDRQRARFDAIEIGMTKDEIVAIMRPGDRVVFREYPEDPGGPGLIICRMRSPRFRDGPFAFHFYVDEGLILRKKKVVVD